METMITERMALIAGVVLFAFGTIYWWIRYVRAQADRDAMSMALGEISAMNRKISAMNSELTHDRARLNWLEQQQDRFPDLRGVIFRWSEQGRGWRLHQTTRLGTVSTVRGAIDVARHKAEREASER